MAVLAGAGRGLRNGGRGGKVLRVGRRSRVNAAAEAVVNSDVAAGGDNNEVGGRRMTTSPFGGPREISGIGSVAAGLPGALRLMAAGALVGGAAISGAVGARAGASSLGGDLDGVRGAAVSVAAGAVAAGAAGGACVFVDADRKKSVLNAVHNALVATADPVEGFGAQDMAALSARFGTDIPQVYEQDLARYYDQYLTSILPEEADQMLRGDEVERLRAFRAALGLEEQVAAGVHMDVAQRTLRMRLEGDSKTADADCLRRFQKLVFVSHQLIGEKKAKFLLPWKRRVGVTDAQVKVALREVGGKLFDVELENLDGNFATKPEVMLQLKRKQEELGLEVATAASRIRTAARRQLEGLLRPAVEIVRSRSSVAKDAATVVEAVKQALATDEAAAKLAESDEAIAEIGAGNVCLVGSGGAFDTPAGAGDLKELFRVFVQQTLASGNVGDQGMANFAKVQAMFGMKEKEYNALLLDETSKAYESQLRAAVADGSIDAAESKAFFLQSLCESLRFDPAKAFALHEHLFRNKLYTLSKSGKISDADDEDLVRMQVLLCIPEETAEKARMEICSRPYLAAVKNALASGAESFGDYALNSIRAAQGNMRLSADNALELFSTIARREMLQFIQRSRSAKEPAEGTKELANLVSFNQRVITPIVEDLKPSDAAAEEKAKELAEMIKKAAQEKGEEDVTVTGAEVGDAVEARKKEEEEEAKESGAAAAKDAIDTEDINFMLLPPEERFRLMKSKGMAANPVREVQKVEVARGQRLITLEEDLPVHDRKDFYRKYFLNSIQGDTVEGPMGLKVAVERDMDATMKQLDQFAGLLALTPIDVSEIQKEFSVQAYTNAAEQMLGGGVTEAATAQLKGMQAQLGLSDEDSEKIVKAVTSKKMMSTLKQQMASGTVTMDTIKQMKDAGMDVGRSIGLPARTQLYKKTVDSALTSGTGEVDAEQMRTTLVKDLGLDEAKTATLLDDLTKSRKSDAIVQAVSFLRQQRREESIKALNNLIACSEIVAGPAAWGVRGELEDLYMLYAKGVTDAGKREKLAAALDISSADAKVLEASASAEVGGDGSGSTTRQLF